MERNQFDIFYALLLISFIIFFSFSLYSLKDTKVYFSNENNFTNILDEK